MRQNKKIERLLHDISRSFIHANSYLFPNDLVHVLDDPGPRVLSDIHGSQVS
jgi:hypothetical protein